MSAASFHRALYSQAREPPRHPNNVHRIALPLQIQAPTRRPRHRSPRPPSKPPPRRTPSFTSHLSPLQDGERRVREELQHSIQRQNQSEAAYERKLRELQAEIASRDEVNHKLESKVRCLENENCLLEKKEKELKGTIDSLLQSREVFVAHYEESTYSLKCSVEMRDRKLAVLSEKLHEHMLLFTSIEKEAASIKKLVGNIQLAMNGKEQVVSELKGKMETISTLEKEFVEKIRLLENRITRYKHELQRRDATILELEEKFKVEKIHSNSQKQNEELRKALSVKEEVVRKLTSEKQALHYELHNLEHTVQKIQDAVMKMTSEDQKAMSSVFEGQEVCEMATGEENENSEDLFEANEGDSVSKCNGGFNPLHEAMPFHPEHMLVNDSSNRHSVRSNILKPPPHPQSECSNPSSTNGVHTRTDVNMVTELKHPQSEGSDPSSTTNVRHISSDVNMGDCTSLVCHVGSESSTNGAEARADALEAAPP